MIPTLHAEARSRAASRAPCVHARSRARAWLQPKRARVCLPALMVRPGVAVGYITSMHLPWRSQHALLRGEGRGGSACRSGQI